ncbi:MAG: transposase [Chloroflexota bacterium]
MTIPSQYYRRNMPHIHPDGYPLFITFRLANSLPIQALEDLLTRRKNELSALRDNSQAERYKIEKKYFGRYDDLLDKIANGPQWLADEAIARIVEEEIRRLDSIRYQLFAYCIMPNHVHLLLKVLELSQALHHGKTAKYPVTDSLRLLKGKTARLCNLYLHRNGAFWHHESYDHYVRDEQELSRIIQYIINNPVKAGLVQNWQDWQFTHVAPDMGNW